MSAQRCPKCGHEWFDCECTDTRPPVWDADAWVYPDGTTHRERRAAAKRSTSMSLAQDMLAAAEVLEAVSALYDASHPSRYAWSADDLRKEAPHVESEDTE